MTIIEEKETKERDGRKREITEITTRKTSGFFWCSKEYDYKVMSLRNSILDETLHRRLATVRFEVGFCIFRFDSCRSVTAAQIKKRVRVSAG